MCECWLEEQHVHTSARVGCAYGSVLVVYTICCCVFVRSVDVEFATYSSDVPNH